MTGKPGQARQGLTRFGKARRASRLTTTMAYKARKDDERKAKQIKDNGKATGCWLAKAKLLFDDVKADVDAVWSKLVVVWLAGCCWCCLKAGQADKAVCQAAVGCLLAGKLLAGYCCCCWLAGQGKGQA